MPNLTVRIVYVAALLLTTYFTRAQDMSSAGGYMSYFGERIQNVNQTYMNYLSAVSHGKSARKVEKLRNKTLDMILTAKGEVAGSPGFKGDKTYRDATAAYLKTTYLVFNEDYSKIVNMEEIAEQSYDAMEAYLLAQQKAGEKLEEASKKQHESQKEFATKNGINLVEKKDELDEKLEIAGRVNEYYNKVYLIFFKNYKQDMYLTDAINKNDLNAMEQARNALETYATAGLEEVAAMGSFESDASLVAACKVALNFYKDVATKKMEPISNFILASDNFGKLKKSFEKSGGGKTQGDVDAYNKAVADMNKGSNNYNKANQNINKERSEMLNNWNNTVKEFFDAHVPYAK